jgi:hypothetical protein
MLLEPAFGDRWLWSIEVMISREEPMYAGEKKTNLRQYGFVHQKFCME